MGQEQVWTPPSDENFALMSDKEKRVIIAKDVIAAINAKRYTPENMVYYAPTEDIGIAIEENKNKELQELIKNKKCNVCALGAMFVSAVDRFNSLKLGEVKFSITGKDSYPLGYGLFETPIYNYLRRFFNSLQLTLIEYAFERKWTSLESRDMIDREVISRAFAFCYGINEPADRIIKIMNNIIKNEGTFIP